MLNLARQHQDLGIYRSRSPQAGGYFCCVQDHFEQLEMVWLDRYASCNGFWRPYVTAVIYRYQACSAISGKVPVQGSPFENNRKTAARGYSPHGLLNCSDEKKDTPG